MLLQVTGVCWKWSAVPQASLGSMVKSQKSAGRKSSQCHRRQVLKKKKKDNHVCLLLFLLFPSLSDYGKHASFTLCWGQNSYPHVQNVLGTTIMLWLDFTVCLCVSVEKTLISTFQIIKKASTEHLYPRHCVLALYIKGIIRKFSHRCSDYI